MPQVRFLLFPTDVSRHLLPDNVVVAEHQCALALQFAGDDFVRRATFPLTESAKAVVAEWNEFTDNSQLDCIAPGMPATMGNPYPIEFRRAGNNIELRQEEFDVVRTIHIGEQGNTALPPSPLGYSVGRWKDDSTLLIETTCVDWPCFNRVGVPQSDAVEVRERFVLNDEAGCLRYRIRVTDPPTLTAPYEYDALWVWEPNKVLGRYDCSVEPEGRCTRNQ